MTQKALLNNKLTDLIVLTEVPLVRDSRDTPDIIFPYLEAPLTTLIGIGNNIAYVKFNPNSWERRRNPNTNETLYNIDLPIYGTTPSLEHALIGSKSHIDTSLKTTIPIYPVSGYSYTEWSGMVWRNTDDLITSVVITTLPDGTTTETLSTQHSFYSPEGLNIPFRVYLDDPDRVIDLRYDKELFY